MVACKPHLRETSSWVDLAPMGPDPGSYTLLSGPTGAFAVMAMTAG